MSLTRPSTDLSGCIRHALSLVNHQAPVCDCTVRALWPATPRRLIPYRQPACYRRWRLPACFVERAFEFNGDLPVSIDQLPLQLGYRHRILLLVPKDSRLIDFHHGFLDIILNFTMKAGGIVANGPDLTYSFTIRRCSTMTGTFARANGLWVMSLWEVARSRMWQWPRSPQH